MAELAIIPEPRREAVRTALRTAFGTGTAKNLTPIRGGVSGALILRFELGERAYVLADRAGPRGIGRPATKLRLHVRDGTRLWLVDWELAFSNDPLVDVAIASTDLAATPELETAILEAALGSAPDRFACARLTVIRLLTRLFYGCVVLGSLLDARRISNGSGGRTARVGDARGGALCFCQDVAARLCGRLGSPRIWRGPETGCPMCARARLSGRRTAPVEIGEARI